VKGKKKEKESHFNPPPPPQKKREKKDRQKTLAVLVFLLNCHVASCQMVMEAIMESLKDMKMSQPLEDTSSCASSNSTETCQENGKPSSWAADEDSRGPSQSNLTLISGTNASGSQASQSLHISNGCPPKALSLESSPQASSVKSDQLTNTSSTESADGTKAMVTVVKNSSGHIIDGLFKRWDRNFFRSTR